MTESENEQLRGMTGEIVHNGLHRALRTHRWADFARGYNGSNFAINKYDTRLAAAFHKYSQGGLPDLAVRAAQVYLTYLNLNPGTVDGLPGRFTFSALNEFQRQQGLPISHEIDHEILSRLKEKALSES
jgi:peptidoglycan hydrolase-like protein with peptidoglycan-binding domain